MVLRALAAWREEMARDRNKPRSSVARDEALVEIARKAPTTVEGLRGLRAVRSRELDRHAEEGFGPVRDAWRTRSLTLGREVIVKADGREIAGTAEDIDEAGALLVRGPGGLERITAGDVTHLRPRAG